MIRNLLHITRNNINQKYSLKNIYTQQNIYNNTKSLFNKQFKNFSSKNSKQSGGRSAESNIKQLIYLVKPEFKYFVAAAILHGIAAAFLMYIPKVIPEFGKLYSNKKEKIEETDTQEVKEEKQKKNKEIDNKYKEFIYYWGTLCLFSGLFTYGRRFASTDLGNRIQFRLRNRLYTNLIQRDAEFFYRKDISTANFVHKLSNDVSVIGNSLSMDLFFGFRAIFFILGGGAFMIIKSQDLLLPCFLIMGVLTASTKVIGGYQRKAKQEETQLLTKTSELAYERLGNMKLIKISNTEQYEKKLYYKTLTEYYDKTRQVSKYTALNFSILEGFGFASLIGLFTYGSYLVTIGVSHPDMVSSAVYAFYVGTGFRGLLNSYTELAKTAGLYDGIRDLVGDLQKDQIYNQSDMISNRKDYAQEFQKMLDGSKNKEYIPIDFQNVSAPEITLKNVTFKYDEYGQERSLFQHFNLTIPKGKIIAIVGPSGCGKTSLLNLITRLYKPQEGEILIDGENLNSLDKDWVQQNISYVTQEPIIFQGTILENLEYGNQGFDLSFENIEKACQIANADGFINDLPEKYNTVLFERGSSLSGGQRQRLILARALVKNPKILIMDEGTANLDQESEISIIKDLKEICKNRTCILITHKIENYKQIIDETIQMEKPAHLKALEEENEQKQQQ